MYVKLILGDLNPSLYPPHLTNICTCGMTTVPRVRSSSFNLTLLHNCRFVSYVFEG